MRWRVKALWNCKVLYKCIMETPLTYSFILLIFLKKKGKVHLQTGWKKFNLDINLCLINIFSVFYLPCFYYWNMKHLWILNNSWAAAWVQEVPCLKKSSLADSGQGKFVLKCGRVFCFYFTLPFRSASYFIPLAFKVYFAEFHFPGHSLPSSPS